METVAFQETQCERELSALGAGPEIPCCVVGISLHFQSFWARAMSVLVDQTWATCKRVGLGSTFLWSIHWGGLESISKKRRCPSGYLGLWNRSRGCHLHSPSHSTLPAKQGRRSDVRSSLGFPGWGSLITELTLCLEWAEQFLGLPSFHLMTGKTPNEMIVEDSFGYTRNGTYSTSWF